MDVVRELRAFLPVTSDGLVRTPLHARDDRRRVGRERLHVLRCPAEERATHEERAQPFDPASEPVLDPLRASHPERVAQVPAAASPRFGGVPVRQVVRLGRREAPRAPGAVRALRPEANHSRSLPVQADEIERVRRLSDEAAAHIQVAGDDARRRHRKCRRGEEDGECGRKELHARATRIRESQRPVRAARLDLVALLKS